MRVRARACACVRAWGFSKKQEGSFSTNAQELSLSSVPTDRPELPGLCRRHGREGGGLQNRRLACEGLRWVSVCW